MRLKSNNKITFFLFFLASTSIICNFTAGEIIEKSIFVLGSQQYQKGYRYNVMGWIYVHIEGAPYERGFQHGYLLADEIVDLVNRLSHIFPHKGAWNFLRHRATRLFWNKYPLEFQQEIQGIADGVTSRGKTVDGASITSQDIVFMNEMFEMLSGSDFVTVEPIKTRIRWLFGLSPTGLTQEPRFMEKCSAFMATGNATTDGRVVAAQSTWGWTMDGYIWSNYIAERFNIILDVKPDKGHRFLMTTGPGFIWSGEDYYQNDDGIVIQETTLNAAPSWSRRGVPLVVRARTAIQYGDSIDDVVSYFLKNNNGLYPNDWMIADTKTGEIASLELALRHHKLTRTTNGYLWSCNNAKDNQVRWELNSRFGLGIISSTPLNGPFVRKQKFIPSDRDIEFQSFLRAHNGKISVDVARILMGSQPIDNLSTDAKITDSEMMKNLGFWAYMGNPSGEDFIASKYPSKYPRQNYTDMPSCGWVQIYALQESALYHEPSARDQKEPGELITSLNSSNGNFSNGIYSSPVIAHSTLYTTSWNGNITAFDLEKNMIQWKQRIGDVSASTPLTTQTMVFAGSDTGISALDIKTGEIVWHQNLNAVSSTPAVRNGLIYCSSHDGTLYALYEKNGSIKWTVKTGGGFYSSPTISENTIYIGSNDRNLYAINCDTGSIQWIFETQGPICSSPNVSHHVVYVGSWDANVYALDQNTGHLIWKTPLGWGVIAAPCIDKDTCYIGCCDNNFYALDAENGNVEWIVTTGAAIQSTATMYGGTVFFGCDDGRVYGVDASDGSIIWTDGPDYCIKDMKNYLTKPIVSSPIVSDGKLYIGSLNGKLYCYDPQTSIVGISSVLTKTNNNLFYIFIFIALLGFGLISIFYVLLRAKSKK